jgi:uncharacterized protein YkwD
MGLVSRTIRNALLASSVAAALGTPACVAPSPAPSPLGGAPPGVATGPRARSPDLGFDPDPELDLATVTADLVAAHNRVRAAHRRAPLTVSGPLEAAAREHARDMARHRWMSHRGSDLSSPFRRMAAHGYTYRRAGENVAAGYPSVDSVMKGWMLSPGHRANILGRFSEIGAACATATNGTRYWCVTFGAPPAQ